MPSFLKETNRNSSIHKASSAVYKGDIVDKGLTISCETSYLSCVRRSPVMLRTYLEVRHLHMSQIVSWRLMGDLYKLLTSLMQEAICKLIRAWKRRQHQPAHICQKLLLRTDIIGTVRCNTVLCISTTPWSYGGKAPRILNFLTGCKRVVSFTHHLSISESHPRDSTLRHDFMSMAHQIS
jgi:hypothetical protein